MLKTSILFAAFITFGCGNTSQMANRNYSDLPYTNLINVNKTPVVEEKTASPCKLDLKEKLKTLFNEIGRDLNTYKPEEDKDLIFIKELKSCPREETVNSLLELQKAYKDDFELKAKSSYLLIKLGHNKRENGKFLVSTYFAWNKEILERYKDPNYKENVINNKYDNRFDGEGILILIADIIEKDDSGILSDAFDLSLVTDGAMSETLAGILGEEFKKEPEEFLRKLKVKSKKVTDSVYMRVCYSTHIDELTESIFVIPKSSNVYSMSREMLSFVKYDKACINSRTDYIRP